MKILAKTLTIVLLLLSTESSYSQVTNLLVNGSATNFSVTTGDIITWGYDIPAGGSAFGELWLDLNLNHAIDPGTDIRVLTFLQTDGDTIGNNGPPDMDGIANGSVDLTMPLGLAPQNYVMRITHNGSGPSIWGSVAPLSSPVFTVSGTVSGPAGFDLRYIVVEASPSGSNDVEFWHALTDSLGNFTIGMTSDTAGNPWEVGIYNLPPPNTVQPQYTLVTIDGNITGVDFTVSAAAAQVLGYLLDEAGDSLGFREVYIARNDSMGGNVNHWMQTDEDGRFWFGIPIGELNGDTWRLATPTNNDPITTHIVARGMLPALNNGDSLWKNITLYSVNSTIDGFMQIDGVPPGFPVTMYAVNYDSGESYAFTNGGTGAFSIPVSDKIADYVLGLREYLGPYFMPNVVAHPGETGVIYNLTTTGVGDETGTLPAGYALGQNYPNPFNPTTTIPYAIPSAGRVVMKLYDILGREAAVLVDEEQNPGLKTAIFDATGLPSGVYQYRIISGTFSAVKKLLIVR